jgi:hypothetical protein
MLKIPSVCLLALALTVSPVFADFFPIGKDTRDPGSSTPETNSASDWNYDSTRTAISDVGDTADSHDAVELSAKPDEQNTISPAIGPSTLCDALVASAQANGLPVVFFSNLIWQESRFHPDAVSRAGALGIAQFMPNTAAAVGLENPLDPQQALPASARLLAKLYREFGNLGLAAAAYNAGGKRVSDWLSKDTVLPKETRDYVLTITGRPVEQWSPASSQGSTLSPAKKMPCLDVAIFAAANEDATSRETPAPEKSDTESGRVAGVLQSARLINREALLSRVADMHERWAGLRKHWAALSASRHSPAELPMDVGLAQSKKASAKKPIRVADASLDASHKGKSDRFGKRRHIATNS